MYATNDNKDIRAAVEEELRCYHVYKDYVNSTAEDIACSNMSVIYDDIPSSGGFVGDPTFSKARKLLESNHRDEIKKICELIDKWSYGSSRNLDTRDNTRLVFLGLYGTSKTYSISTIARKIGYSERQVYRHKADIIDALANDAEFLKLIAE